MPNPSRYFLPYQMAWLKDDSPFKIWEKTRRGGMTYVQSYEDVRDAVGGKWDVWFSSADETAAKEYILYCEKWAKLFNKAAERLDSTILEGDKAITVFQIKFLNGKRITALSSSPSQFRSKGGKVVLDEFAWHKDQKAMWDAAEPVTTWGFPLRIISSHNGKGSLFYKHIQNAEETGAVVHKTTIFEAVEQGLVDKILKRKTTHKERHEWLERKRKKAGPTAWMQEYCCEPIDESTAFLPYSLIESCSEPGIIKNLDDIQNPFVLGMDIARRRNLSVIWISELIERRHFTRIVDEMEKTKFSTQYDVLKKYLKHPKFWRASLDATGMGEQMAEDAQRDFGAYAVEAVRFNNTNKFTMAEALKTKMEDRLFIVPSDGGLSDRIKEDFHSVQQEVTSAGNTRFMVGDNDEDPNSHADRFWAAALCENSAGNDSLGVPQVTTLPKAEGDWYKRRNPQRSWRNRYAS